MIHSERAPHYAWLLLLFRLLALLFILLFVYMVLERLPGWWGMALASFLLLWANMAFANMRFELHEDGFEAWFWPFRSRTPYAEIERVEVRPRFPWIAGFGLHYFWGTWWFTTRYQSCVVIHREGRSKVAFTPKEPEAFAKLLRQRVKKTKKK